MFEWMDPLIFFFPRPRIWYMGQVPPQGKPAQPTRQKGPDFTFRPVSLWLPSLALWPSSKCIFLHCLVALLHERANFFIRRRARAKLISPATATRAIALQRGATLPLTPPAPCPSISGLTDASYRLVLLPRLSRRFYGVLVPLPAKVHRPPARRETHQQCAYNS